MTAAVLPGSYRRVLAASSLSNLSDGIRLAALPLLAVTLTRSPFLVGLVAAAGLVPGPLFGLWAGWLSDRFDRGALAQTSNALRTVLLLALATLIIFGQATIPLVMMAAFILGTSEVLADNALSTLIPSLVDDSQLERANSRMVASEIMGNEFIGPALGAVLFSVGMAVPFLSNAALLATSVLLLSGLPLLNSTDNTASAPDQADSGRIRHGITYLMAYDHLRTLTLASALLIAIDGAWFALLVVLATTTLGLPNSAFGLLLASGAFGGMAGAALADRFPQTSLRAVTASVFAVMAVSLVGLGLYPRVSTTVVVLITTSGAFAVWNVFALTARQRLTPPNLLGRVTGAYKTIVLTAAAAGTVIGALIAQIISVETCLVLAGFLAALSTPFFWLTSGPTSTMNQSVGET